MDLIGKLIGQLIAQPAYNLAIKHINYIACVDRLIKELEEKRDKLNDKKEEIDLRVERASGEGKVIIPQVNKWLEQVSRCIDNVNQFLDEEERITDDNKSGFHQCCCFIPNHHKTGKEAENLTTTLNELLEEACFSDVGVPPLPSPSPEMALPPTAYSKEFDSRESLLENIIEALKVHDTIGIYGMAGVGKTVLVERLVVEVNSRKLFDEVGMAVVSKNPSYTVIRDEIADRILGHDKESHAKSEEGKKDWLQKELEKLKQQQKKVLLVLDDAWEPLFLHKVGIPCTNKDFKIVVTSRFRSVCAKMGVKETFEVCGLDEREAWILFRQSLGDYAKVLDSGDGYKDVAEEMVRHFEGLPLAIVTLAGALIGRPLPTWRVAAKCLNERQLYEIEGMSEKVIGAIKFSFDDLRDRDAQIIFLLCCLFPEDWSIDLNVLMRYGIGLGLFADGLSHRRDRIVDITEKLKSRSLLLEGDKRKSGSLFLEGDKDVKVRMHDVTRDVALHIASKGEYGYLVKEDKEGRMGNVASSNIGKLREKHAISVLTTKTNPIDFFGRDEEEYPDLLILRLQVIKDYGYDFLRRQGVGEYGDDPMPIEFPACFFERIGNLKVLEIREMTIDTSTSCPLGCLEKNLRTLCLYNCLVIDITEIGELTNLEILDLRGSQIRGGLNGAVQRLSKLRVLDLTDFIMSRLADNFVGDLSAKQLEGLYLRNVKIRDKDDIGDAVQTSLVELEELTHLEMLEVVVRSPEQVTNKFLSIFSNLSSFHLTLMGKFYRTPLPSVFGPPDKILNLYHITTKKYLPIGLGHLFGAPNELYLYDCGVPIMSLQYYKDEFSNLTYLSIMRCDAEDFVIKGRRIIKSAAESIHDDGLTPPFAKLEHLVIREMKRLRYVCAPNQDIVLSKLQFLLIENCPLLRYVFTKSVAIQLQQLKTIEISNCEEMKEIIFTNSRDNNHTSSIGIGISSSSEEEGTTNNCYEIMDDTNSIILPSLQKIELERLPHLKHFAPRNTSPYGADRSTLFEEQVKFPELERLRLISLDSCEFIWGSHFSTGSFGQLRVICIKKCKELRYIFSAAIARGLVQLWELDIRECSKLEEVVVMESVNDIEEENSITFPRLHTLLLFDFPHLKHFVARKTSPSGADRSTFFGEQVKFPELKVLSLIGLDSCEKIWESHLPTGSFDQLRKICIRKCKELRYIFSAAVARGLVQLQELLITECSKLEEVVVMESVNDNEEENNITFPRLQCLTLDDLPHLKQFAARNTSPSSADQSTLFGEQVKYPELTWLSLSGLDSCEKIWESHLPTGSFRQLRVLNIWNCDELRYIFSVAVARGLVQLQELDIQSCSKLEEVVVMESVNDNEEENKITFPRLHELILKDSDSLHSFCLAQNSVLEFPSLEEIEIEENANMQRFSYGSLHTPILTGRYGGDDLNTVVARLYEEIKTSSSDSELLVDNQP